MFLQKLIISFLETLSAAFLGLHVFFAVIPPLCLLYVTFFTRFWPIVLLSIFWVYYDRETPHRGGRTLSLVKFFPLWKYLNSYFPVTLIKTADLDPSKNYLFCLHPHGLVVTSCVANFLQGYSTAKDLFPGLKFHTATIDYNCYFPFVRDYFMGLGTVSASARSLMYLLNDNQRGNMVALVIGGAAEAILTKRGLYQLVLKRRNGFIKVALKTGCCVVPVVCFGENDIMDLWYPREGSLLAAISPWVKKLIGYDICFPNGRFSFLKFIPEKFPLVTIVGKPMDIPKVAEPSEELIDHYHSLYIEELIKLFNEQKHKYVEDPDNTELMIVQ